MSELNDAVIEEYAKAIKLPALRRECDQLARQARADSWSYEEYLRELLDAEVRAGEASTTARRLREPRFLDLETLGQIDWTAMEGVSKQQILELATCQFIEQPEDVTIAGPIGTGKSHLAIALGVEAAKRRFRVLFVKAADLVRQLLETGAASSHRPRGRPRRHRGSGVPTVGVGVEVLVRGEGHELLGVDPPRVRRAPAPPGRERKPSARPGRTEWPTLRSQSTQWCGGLLTLYAYSVASPTEGTRPTPTITRRDCSESGMRLA